MRAHSDMNLTPLVDVLLVLLVIFMAVLPLTQKGIDSQLPSKTRLPSPLTLSPRRAVRICVICVIRG